MPTAAQNQKDADRAKRWVTMASVATAVVLLSIKLGVWLQSGSVALLASAADSGLDLAAALATFVAVRYAASPADQEHRYGHGKAEAFASLLQAGLVFASAALIGEQAIEHILHPRPVRQESWALGVMAVSIVMTVGLIAAQSAMLRRGRSVAVSADRMHYITDFGSNIIALAAIGVTALTGLTAIDAVGGLAVAVLLLWGAVVVFREASRELMDRELPDDARKRIGDLARDDPQVLAVHQLRTRAAGPTVHIQMHADLSPELSLDEAHKIVVAAEKRILEEYPGADILIHADPRGRAEPHGVEAEWEPEEA